MSEGCRLAVLHRVRPNHGDDTATADGVHVEEKACQAAAAAAAAGLEGAQPEETCEAESHAEEGCEAESHGAARLEGEQDEQDERHMAQRAHPRGVDSDDIGGVTQAMAEGIPPQWQAAANRGT